MLNNWFSKQGTKKREYLIKIVVDEEGAIDRSATHSRPGGNEFLIDITPASNGAPLASVTAHELGHVLGSIFETPGYRADPRITNPQHANLLLERGIPLFPEEQGRMIASETEAWDIAEEMGNAVSLKDREHSLASYRKGAEFAKNFWKGYRAPWQ